MTSGYRKMIKKLTFERDLELPAGTRGMAFSYKGRVRDVGVDLAYRRLASPPQVAKTLKFEAREFGNAGHRQLLDEVLRHLSQI